MVSVRDSNDTAVVDCNDDGDNDVINNAVMVTVTIMIDDVDVVNHAVTAAFIDVNVVALGSAISLSVTDSDYCAALCRD